MTTDPIADFRAGKISAEVALARLLLTGDNVAERVAEVAELHRLLQHHAHRLAPIQAMLAYVDHAASADVQRIAAMFDDAVSQSPEASVALYSLGDQVTLERATAELMAWLDAERLIGPARDVLDLGCGIGRVSRALAPRFRSLLGIDVSPRMIAA